MTQRSLRPLNEEERLAALASYRVLDTEPEPPFDDLATVAAEVCGTPIAMVSLVDRDRQWFKSKLGVDIAELPRELTICTHTILDTQILLVGNTLEDERFRDNPLVVGEPGVRFYAGAPLVDRDGFALGSLCAMDYEPRELSATQTAALESLARLAIDQLELRRMALQLSEALRRVRVLDDLLPVCAYCRKVRKDDEYWQDLESYVRERSGGNLTHGVCPECFEVELAKTETHRG